MSVADKKLAKQVKLLDAAYELFAKKGVNITAIDDVVKLAGVAKGTFYLYFRDKYDLLDQIVLSKSEKIIGEAVIKTQQMADSCVKSGSEKIIFFTDFLLDYLEKNKDLAALISKNIAACSHLIMTDTENKMSKTANTIVEIIMSEGIEREDAYKYLYLLSNMISTVCCEAILTGSPYTIEELRPQLHNIINKLMA